MVPWWVLLRIRVFRATTDVDSQFDGVTHSSGDEAWLAPREAVESVLEHAPSTPTAMAPATPSALPAPAAPALSTVPALAAPTLVAAATTPTRLWQLGVAVHNRRRRQVD